MLGWYKGNSLQIQGKICQIKIRKVQLMAQMATSSLCQPEHILFPSWRGSGLTWRRQSASLTGSLEVYPCQHQPRAQLAPAGRDALPRAGTLRWMWHKMPGVIVHPTVPAGNVRWETFHRAVLAGHISRLWGGIGRWLGNN